ncbi:MAG TPA: LLM class flavin-dependent oxidoreductase [Gemmatimonadaceae bacterium]|nr:LLM class flavin-dependent oxidoreductase [Gemmatimonadaceae bacterium]
MNHSAADPLDLLWFCQLAADGEFIGTRPERKPTLHYISSLVETAAEMGFSSLLTATNFHAEHEAWTASVATLARTDGAGLLIAVRPGMFHPAMFAKMAATAANLFPGRVRINVVTGSNPAENAMYGDMEGHAERYARTREFIAICRELWKGEPVTHESARYPFTGAVVSPPPSQPVPIYLGGHSADAQAIAAELADVYLVWGDTIDGIRKRLETMRAQEARVTRLAEGPLTYGLRCHVVVRETEAEAWAAADRLISRIDPAVRRKFIETTASVDSEGQKRQLALAGGGSLVVEPHLWAGVGLARSGVGVAIVGDPQQVADKLHQYRELGVSTFILSGYPHLEECRRFGEMVMPLLRDRGAPRAASNGTARGPAAPVPAGKRATGVAPVT